MNADSQDNDILTMPGIDPLPGSQDQDEIDLPLTDIHAETVSASFSPTSPSPNNCTPTEDVQDPNDVLNALPTSNLSFPEGTEWLERCLLQGLGLHVNTTTDQDDCNMESEIMSQDNAQIQCESILPDDAQMASEEMFQDDDQSNSQLLFEDLSQPLIMDISLEDLMQN